MALLIAGCATPKTPPPAVNPKPVPGFLQKIRTRRIELNQMMANVAGVIPQGTNVLVWKLPPDASIFCWTLQISSNLVNWVDLPGACVTDPLDVYATNALSFFRLKGH